jgi:2-aminoadipate transaminase
MISFSHEPDRKPLRLARRVDRMPPSAVREILKVAEQPDVLSFAGGLPAPELFPTAAIEAAFHEVLATESRAALQYSTTEGFAPLREWIAARLTRKGIKATADDVLITNGSQQGIDLAARVLLDPGDVVAVEDPSYLAALQNFGGCEAEVVPVASDANGMDVDALAEVVRTRKPKMIYLVPDFQNPTGTTLALERRARLVELAESNRIPVLEDGPYSELRFRGEHLPPLASFDRSGVVIHLGTFSKTLAPGLRIGWMTGPREVLRAATIAKQAADLHTGTLAQRAAAALLRRFDFDDNLAMLRGHYGERSAAMMAALERHMPEGTRWTRPDGGMFTWVALPGGLVADELFAEALREKVAFVPGTSFFAGEPRLEYMRLNYSNRSPEFIDEGMKRLGAVIRSHLHGGHHAPV